MARRGRRVCTAVNLPGAVAGQGGAGAQAEEDRTAGPIQPPPRPYRTAQAPGQRAGQHRGPVAVQILVLGGCINRLRIARKKMAVFGLRTLTTTPWANRRRRVAGGGASSSAEAWRPRSFCTPSHNRYAAPAYFTAANAVADDASSADRPSAAAATWTTEPVCTPSTETGPAPRPWETLRVTM